MSKINPQITIKFLQELARDLLFELDDKQCKKLMLEFDAIEKQMSFVRKIDASNIEPLDYLFDMQKTYLRADIVENALDTDKILAAAPDVKDNYIIINKVIGE